MVSDKGVLKRYIVTPDKHAPLHDKKAISVVKQAIEIVQPDGYIDRRICMGNHEEWLTSFVEAHPYLTNYTFEAISRIKERGYKLYKAGVYFNIGKLHFYHGHHFGGQYHTANHLRKLGVSIMYGHYHSMQMMSITGLKGPIEAWCIGCLKDMSSEKNKWLKGRPHQWVHSFAIVDFYDKGNFAVTPITIVNGKASLWGYTLKG